MKSKFLLIVAFALVAFISCEKESKIDGYEQSILDHEDQIKFSYKRNEVLVDAKIYGYYSLRTDTLNIVAESSSPRKDWIRLYILNFKGTGTYIIDQDGTGEMDSKERYSRSSVFFQYRKNEDDQNSSEYVVKDTAAIVKIETYDSKAQFISGTFEAKGLRNRYHDDRVTITEGSFFVGTKLLKNVKRLAD